MSDYLTLTRSPDFRPAPLFGDRLQGDPHVFDFSANNPNVAEYASQDFEHFQQQVFDELEAHGKSWGIGHYLEERATLLRHFPQMVESGRVVHVGLDIIAPPGAELYAPLEGVVHAVGLDDGAGNYGGYVVLAHEVEGVRFSTFLGHLETDFPVEVGKPVAAGALVGRLGTHGDSGQWFTHTHLQVLTERALAEGRMLQGYITRDDIEHVAELFPTPYPLFRTA